MEKDEGPQQWKMWLFSRTGVVTLIFLGVALFYLLAEHRAHFFGALPYLLLLLCFIGHFFMHGKKHH